MTASHHERWLTPARRVRGLGTGHAGTQIFWQQRTSGIALISLTIFFVVIVIVLTGRNHAAVVQILGAPLVAILMLLFVGTSVYHMWIGMQEIILDYVHADVPKFVAVMANTFFCFLIGATCIFSILKIAFGL